MTVPCSEKSLSISGFQVWDHPENKLEVDSKTVGEFLHLNTCIHVVHMHVHTQMNGQHENIMPPDPSTGWTDRVATKREKNSQSFLGFFRPSTYFSTGYRNKE